VTERWERELRRLGSIRAPSGVRARVGEGPKGEDLPAGPGRVQRLLAGTVGLAVFIASAVFAFAAFGPGDAPAGTAIPPDAVIARFEVRTGNDGEGYPAASMTVGDRTVDVQGGSWGWRGDDGSVLIADTAVPEFSVTDYVDVESGAQLVTEGTAESVSGSVHQGVVGPLYDFDDVGETLELADGEAPLPRGEGRYLLELEAAWPQGSRTFYFPVRVVEPASAHEAVLALAAGQQPSASLSYGGETAEPQVRSYCWQQGSAQMCADTFLEPFKAGEFLQVDEGVILTTNADDTLQDVSLALQYGDEPASDAPVFPFGGTFETRGRFLLVVSASWQQGDVQFYFPVEVVAGASPTVEPPADGALVATLDAPDDGLPPHLRLSYEERVQDYPGAGRWHGEQIAVVGMLFSLEPTLEPGATLRLEGDATTVEASITPSMSDGRWSKDAITLDVASGEAPLPSGPGSYLLSFDAGWPEGHMGYSVAVTIGHPTAISESPLPTVEHGVVPDVIGLGAGDAEKLVSQAGFVAEVSYYPVSGLAAGLVESTDPKAGTQLQPGSAVTLFVSGISGSVDGYLSGLACPMGDMMPFALTWDGASTDGETAIRMVVDGVLDPDAVSQFRFDQGEQPTGLWEVRRVGDQIAVIYVHELYDIEGIACRGSGIGGV
jgi:hypothetical protein